MRVGAPTAERRREPQPPQRPTKRYNALGILEDVVEPSAESGMAPTAPTAPEASDVGRTAAAARVQCARRTRSWSARGVRVRSTRWRAARDRVASIGRLSAATILSLRLGKEVQEVPRRVTCASLSYGRVIQLASRTCALRRSCGCALA